MLEQSTQMANTVQEIPPEIWDAAIALNRFGYGGSPGAMETITGDPRGWLLAQLEEPPAVPPSLAELPRSDELVTEMRIAEASGQSAMRDFRNGIERVTRAEARRHIGLAMETPSPFRERLVRFWCDHFLVSRRNPRVFPLAFAFEREVVRPYMNGSYVRMLTEAVRHPAFLIQHDNVSSIGRYSIAGTRGAANLKLELSAAILMRYGFADGADLSDRDVVALARMLTGWSVAGPDEPNPGRFVFRSDWHEPNSKLLFARTYPQAGVLEAEAALDWIGRRPVTARRLAEKMARAFIADTPNPDLVSDMLDGFTAGGNSLAGMAEGMVLSDHAWSARMQKMKTPEELVLSAHRAVGQGADGVDEAIAGMTALGQQPKAAPIASGWPNQAAAWASPQQLSERLDWVYALAERIALTSELGGGGEAIARFARAVLGPLLSANSFRRLSVSAGGVEGLALMFSTPEFQRR